MSWLNEGNSPQFSGGTEEGHEKQWDKCLLTVIQTGISHIQVQNATTILACSVTGKMFSGFLDLLQSQYSVQAGNDCDM